MNSQKNRNIHLGGTARSPEDVKSLHSLGLQFAEIPITNPRKFSGLLEAYDGLRQELGIYYLCHGPREGDPNDMKALEGKYLPKVLEILPLMEKLEMPLFTLHLWLDPRFVKQDVITFKIGLLKRIIDRAEDSGIIICLENMSESASHMSTPFRHLPLLNLTLDLAHAQLLTEENRSHAFMEQYPQRIKHIHLHDNRGGDSYRDDLHLLPGEGLIDFDAIFGGLNKINYKGTITLELKPPEIKQCLNQVKAMLSKNGLQIAQKKGDA